MFLLQFDLELCMGYFEECQDVFVYVGDFGEMFVQCCDDGCYVVVVIDQFEDFFGVVVEFDYVFGVEQYMVVLGWFELEVEVLVQNWYVVE